MRSDSRLGVKASAPVAMLVLFTVLIWQHCCLAAVKQVSSVGPWQVMCANEIAGADDCTIVQATVDHKTHRDARIAFSFTDEGDLRLRLKMWKIFGPKKRVSLLTDGDQVGAITMDHCDESGCGTTLVVSQSLADNLGPSHKLVLAAAVSEHEGAYSSLDTSQLKAALHKLVEIVSAKLNVPVSPKYHALLEDQTDRVPTASVPGPEINQEPMQMVSGAYVWTAPIMGPSFYKVGGVQYRRSVAHDVVFNQLYTVPVFASVSSGRNSGSASDELLRRQIEDATQTSLDLRPSTPLPFDPVSPGKHNPLNQ